MASTRIKILGAKGVLTQSNSIFILKISNLHVAAAGQSYQAVIKQILCPSSDAQNVLPQISTLITLG